MRANCNFRLAHDRVLWGAAVMGFFFLLRKSEYLSHGAAVSWFALRYADVQCKNRLGLEAK
ncbi:hypothetical protein PINS_up024501, partial [Pythium insidiosum]